MSSSFDVALLLNHPKEAEEVRLFIEKIAQSKMIIDLMIATASELQIQIEELEDIEKWLYFFIVDYLIPWTWLVPPTLSARQVVGVV